MRWLPMIALVATIVLLAACTGEKSGDETSAVTEVRIGVLAPTTGPNRAAGADVQYGAELATALINGEQGAVSLAGAGSEGLDGLGGAKLRIVAGDTKSSPDTGTSEADRLVAEERVVGLVGAYDAAVTEAASQRTERLGIPFVNGDSTAGYLTERGLTWFFRTGPTDRMLGEALYSTILQQNIPPKRIGQLYTSDPAGETLHQVLHVLAPEAGYEEHGMVSFAPGKPNLVPELEEMRDVEKADGLFIMTPTASETVRVLKTMETMGYRPPQVSVFGGGVTEPQVQQTAGSAGEGLFYSTAWSPRIAGRNGIAKAVMEAYEQRFNQPMTATAAGTFTAVLMFAEAIDNAGSTDPERVRAALLNLDIPGRETIMPWSGVRFDATSHQNVAANGVVEQQVRDALRVVFPNELEQPNLSQAGGS
jgi:branched-chain amino acid transport system substrate-binding protein